MNLPRTIERTSLRNIEETYKLVFKEIILKFINSLEDNEMKSSLLELCKERLQTFNTSYGLNKKMLMSTIRDNGEPYHRHPVEVAKICLLELCPLEIKENQSELLMDVINAIDRFCICVLHDIIEDSDVTYEGLKEIFGEEIAFPVLLISKTPFNKFINDKEDKILFLSIQKSGILNSKGLLSDRFKLKLYIKDKCSSSREGEKVAIFGNNHYKITDEENSAYKAYKILKKKYKKIVDEDFFSNMKSIKKFSEIACFLAKEKGLSLSEGQLEIYMYNAIFGKLADRIHNLRTGWLPQDLDKTIRIIESTQIYFLPLAKEISTQAFNLMNKEISTLGVQLANISNQVDDIIQPKAI